MARVRKCCGFFFCSPMYGVMASTAASLMDGGSTRNVLIAACRRIQSNYIPINVQYLSWTPNLIKVLLPNEFRMFANQ